VRFDPPGRPNPLRVEEVLRPVRDSVKGAPESAAYDFGFRALRFGERMVFRQRNHGLELRIDSLRALEIETRELDRRNLFGSDAAGQLGHRREQDGFVSHDRGRILHFLDELPYKKDKGEVAMGGEG